MPKEFITISNNLEQNNFKTFLPILKYNLPILTYVGCARDNSLR